MWEKKCATERAEKGRSGKHALLVKPSDLCCGACMQQRYSQSVSSILRFECWQPFIVCFHHVFTPSSCSGTDCNMFNFHLNKAHSFNSLLLLLSGQGSPTRTCRRRREMRKTRRWTCRSTATGGGGGSTPTRAAWTATGPARSRTRSLRRRSPASPACCLRRTRTTAPR